MKFEIGFTIMIKGYGDPIAACRKIEKETGLKTYRYQEFLDKFFIHEYKTKIMSAAFEGVIDALDYLDARSRLAGYINLIKEFFDVEKIEMEHASEKRVASNPTGDFFE